MRKSSWTSQEYVDYMKKKAISNREYGFDFTETNIEDDSTIQILNRIANTFNQSRWTPIHKDSVLNFKLMLSESEQAIFDDIKERTHYAYHNQINRTTVAIIPIGITNGCAVRYDIYGNQLDRDIIVINFGIKHVCTMLGEALTYEILEGPLKKYRRSGKDIFTYAVKWYSDQSYQCFASTPWRQVPEEYKAEISYYSGSLQAIMLQFIALHELHHLIANDVDNKYFHTCFAKDGAIHTPEKSGLPDDSLNKIKEQELIADTFALMNLCNWEKRPENAWSNFAQIYLLMSYFEVLENKFTILNDTHPPAYERKKNLVLHANILSKHSGVHQFINDIDTYIGKWSK